ncbi:MAG: hypothetical protein EXS25_08730, partial [Pedosphaera sp.]|nr:hypothetical protein [Pedosphaera sp.]
SRFQLWPDTGNPRRRASLGHRADSAPLHRPYGRDRWCPKLLQTRSCTSRVIVSGGTSSEKGWLAYDAETGRLLWSANGEASSYASAMQVVLAGVKQILVTGPQAVVGLDPASGKAGWRFVWGDPKNSKCSQPVMLGNDRIFVSAGYGAGCAVFEVAASAEGLFTTRELWRGKSMKTQFNNVAVREGHLYGLDDGFMACVDITTDNAFGRMDGMVRVRPCSSAIGCSYNQNRVMLRWLRPSPAALLSWVASMHCRVKRGITQPSLVDICWSVTTKKRRVTNCLQNEHGSKFSINYQITSCHQGGETYGSPSLWT